MTQKNVFQNLVWLGIVKSILLCSEHAHAQQEAPVLVSPNDQVIQSWQQSNPGGAGPALKRDEDGSTQIDWTGGVVVDVYNNNIWSAAGQINTSQATGTFFKNSFTSDIRAIQKNKTVNYFQLGATQSNDLSVLSQSRYQINNLQLGRSGEGYLFMLGDVAPNFSSLSASLGLRGMFGQRQFNDVTVYGFTGLVAESWEALDNKVPRTQYLKDVHGIKVEKMFGTSLKTYLTTQSSSEREPTTVMAQVPTTARGKSRSLTGGFQYQKDQFSVTGETAGSSYEDDGTSDRQGRAMVVDANWRGDGISFRGGYHDISTGYTSLSASAQPGVREAYGGAEWTAASWITVGSDLRRSRQSTRAVSGFESTFVDTDALSTRASVNFGPSYPGWTLAMQQAVSQSINSAEQRSKNSDFSSVLNYVSSTWNSGISVGNGKVVSEVSPSSDSVNDAWSFNLGRNFSNSLPDMAESWNAAINFTAGAQTQRLMAGGKTTNTSHTLAFIAKRAGWGSVNFLMTLGETTQPNGNANLRLRAFQLDGTYNITPKNTLKMYVRNSHRNIDDVLLASKENVAGLQLNINF